jgi:hypothetical protein
MPDRKDPLLELLRPIIEETASDKAPKYYSDWNRAVAGTWLLVAGAYGAHDVMSRYDIHISELVMALGGHAQGAVSVLGVSIALFAMALLGGLWVVEGLPRERAPHEVAGVVWLCVLIGGCTYGLVAGVYLDDEPVVSSYLRAFYLATLAASWMEFFLFARCAWDAPQHRPRNIRPVDRAAQSVADAFGRARLAGTVRRRNDEFAHPATPGML